jgi:hypothetical protein
MKHFRIVATYVGPMLGIEARGKARIWSYWLRKTRTRFADEKLAS